MSSEARSIVSGLPSTQPPAADVDALIMAAASASPGGQDQSSIAPSLRGTPSDRNPKSRQRKDSLHSISGSDTAPGRVTKPRARKSPGSGAKRSEASKRKFICSFSHYGCDVALSSKNEWKRHVSIQHLQLGFYRCDVGSCNPDNNPNTPQHKKVYNDFNRKDLFTQHHRRMHKPESGPGSGPISNDQNSADWRAFEDQLEEVRNRCWHEKRKPPQRSTCGFCGRVFEGEGSWNERMEHVGGHYSRESAEACKEEREDEDLTNWALHEGIIKDAGNGRHVLVDQPAPTGDRSYMARGGDIAMGDAPPVTPTNGQPIDGQYPNNTGGFRRVSFGNSYSSLNGSSRPSSSSGHPIAPALRGPISPIIHRRLGVEPSTTSRSLSNEGENTDRLEDLINTLINPKKPKMSKRLQWKCDCGLDTSVDFSEENENDQRAFHNLGKISIICKNTQSPYLKTSKTEQYEIIPCNDLAGYVKREGKDPTEHSLSRIPEASVIDGSITNEAQPIPPQTQ